MLTELTPSLEEARERLRQTINDYIELDTHLRELEDTNYRVCIFGSARIKPQDPTYHEVFYTAQRLSERGVDVVTGGGPGLMEAANRGVMAAKRRRARSYGLTLDLPWLLERPNRALDVKNPHRRFSSRLDEFIRLSHAVVVAPGGVGTLLELVYAWQLLQLNLVEPRPMLLLGREFWGGLIGWIREAPLQHSLLDVRDLERIQIVDTAEEVLNALEPSIRAYQANVTQAGSPSELPPALAA